MTKRELELLGRAFAAEVNGETNKSPPVLQTRSKLAVKLCYDGLLAETDIWWPSVSHPMAVTIRGYELTDLGRWLYCESCGGEE